jgi:hypothetical protein
MKHLLILIFTFSVFATSAQQKIRADGSIGPTGDYSSVHEDEVKGGTLTYATIVDRNALRENMRIEGMIVYVTETSTFYTLNGGITDADWVAIAGGSQTWQQTLDNGSELDKDNYVNASNNSFTMDSISYSQYISRSIDNPDWVGLLSINYNGISMSGGKATFGSQVTATNDSAIVEASNVDGSDVWKNYMSMTDVYTRFGRATTAGSPTFSPYPRIIYAPEIMETEPEFMYVSDNDTIKKYPYSGGGGGSGWALTGNSGTSYPTNFIGTADAISFRIRTNNSERMLLDSVGRWSVGTNVFTGYNIDSRDADLIPQNIIKGNSANNNVTAKFSLLMIDSLNRPIAGFNNNGRGNLYSYTTTGAVYALYNMATGAADQLAAHYAAGAKNAAGDLNTIGSIDFTTTDATTASMDSKIELKFMNDVNTTSGYTQPNANVLINKYGIGIANSTGVGRLTSWGSNWVGLTNNAYFDGTNIVADDAGAASWVAKLDSRGAHDRFEVGRVAAGGTPAASYTALLTVLGTGNGTLAGTGTATKFFASDNGTSSAPSLSFTSNTSSGFYNSSGEIFAVSNVVGAGFAIQNLNSSNFSGIEYYNASGGLHTFSGANNANGEFRFNNVASGGFIAFKIASADELKIFNSGNVGINNYTADDVALGVNGTVKATTLAMTTPLNTSGSTPTYTLGTASGTGGSVSFNSGANNATGIITVTTGTSPSAGANDLVTVTFNPALSSTPKSIILSPANGFGATAYSQVFVDEATLSSTTFKIIVRGGATLTASSSYKWSYQVLQ